MSIIKTPITIALTVLLLLGVGYLAWDYWNSEHLPTRSLNPYEYNLVQNACNHFAEELEGIEGLYDLVILPIREKRKRNIPEMISDYLSYNTRINITSMDDIYGVIRAHKKDLSKEEITKFDEEAYLKDRYTKKEGFGVLKLYIKDFKSGKRGRGAGIHLAGKIQFLTENKTIQTIEVKPFKQYIKTKFSFIFFSSWMNSISPWWRIIFWLLTTIFFPLLTTSWIVKISGLQSNKYNAYMILGYAGFSIFLAFFLAGFQIYSTWTGMLIFLGFLFSSIYNYEMCDLVDDWN